MHDRPEKEGADVKVEEVAGLDACAPLTPTQPFCSIAEKMVDLNNCNPQISVNY
jgi:hypothetical protein